MNGEEYGYTAPLDKGGLGGFGDRPETLRRLRWRCRRGLIELDVWFERFTAAELTGLSPRECAMLDLLLSQSDMQLLDWLEGRHPPPTRFNRLIERIRASV